MHRSFTSEMSTLFHRLPQNPILTPKAVKPSHPQWKVECLLNPGAFTYQGRIGLLLRVAERPDQEEGFVSTPIVDIAAGATKVVRFKKDDPDLKFTDARVFTYRGQAYLTTLSHLRLAWSTDGVHFTVDDKPTLIGSDMHETFGIEDSRVEFIDGRYYLTYTVVSEVGVAVGMTSTADWKTFRREGIIFPPHNKDCALFSQKIGNEYFALHRPSGAGIGGNFIWIARSPDLKHWGDHRCIATTRQGSWDSERIGAGAAPIPTNKGFLEIYHGANHQSRYCLGTLLLDGDNPYKVIARSNDPVLEPTEEIEKKGFFGNVVFTNGHVIQGDQVTVYYGASDEVICAARASITELLNFTLKGS